MALGIYDRSVIDQEFCGARLSLISKSVYDLFVCIGGGISGATLDFFFLPHLCCPEISIVRQLQFYRGVTWELLKSRSM